MKAFFNPNHLVAATICASRDKLRPYMMGVRAEITAAGTLLVATNGAALVALFHESAPDADGSTVLASATIPLAICTRIKRGPIVTRKFTNPNDGELEIDGDTVRVTADGITYEAAAVASEYPDWRKIAPKKLTGEASTFDPKYLTYFARINKMVSGSKYPPEISHNGNDACIVHLGYPGRAFGVLMPLRNSSVKWAAPEWAKLKTGGKK